MNLTILKNLGLSDKEILVYTTLLKSGAASIRAIATKSGVNRGTTYDVLKKLQASGVVSFYHEKTKQKFVAENPERLLQFVEKKEAKLNDAKRDLNNLIPELQSLQDRDNSTPVTKYYEGRSGVKTILDDVLDSFAKVKDKTYYVFSAKDASNDINAAYPRYTNKRIKKNIKVKVISLAKGGSVKGLDERRWLGTENNSATFIIIYQNKCAFISRSTTDKPVGVIIENNIIYNTQKDIFLKLWDFVG